MDVLSLFQAETTKRIGMTFDTAIDNNLDKHIGLFYLEKRSVSV